MKKFSMGELKLLMTIGNKSMSIAQLSKLYYGRRRVKNKRNSISQMIRSVNKKAGYRMIAGTWTGVAGKEVWTQ